MTDQAPKDSRQWSKAIRPAVGVLLCLLLVASGAWMAWSYLFGGGGQLVPLQSVAKVAVHTSIQRRTQAARTLQFASVPGVTIHAKTLLANGLTAVSPGPRTVPSLSAIVIPTAPRIPLPASINFAGDNPRVSIQAAPAAEASSFNDVERTWSSSHEMAVAMHPSLEYQNGTVTYSAMNVGPSFASAAKQVPMLNIMATFGPRSRSTSGLLAATAHPAPSAPRKLSKAQLIDKNLRLEKARQFVMSMCYDHEGHLWVGTEDGGVQRFDPSAPPLHKWKQYTTKDGLGDNNGYAVACDHQDRIWVGHLNHGVSVFNHNAQGHWQCYEVVGGLSRSDTLSGPIGERVFAIKVCPTDGDVWIGTNRGLTRYSTSRDQWSYFDRSDGLTSNNIVAIAFDGSGRIYCGTDCDGIAMASPTDGYTSWGRAVAPVDHPVSPRGTGLPSNRINAVVAMPDGSVYAGTPLGLAWSFDQGNTWNYVRGKNYAAKVHGRYGGPPKGWTEESGAVLQEDYVTCIAAGSDRHTVWVGHQQTSPELLAIHGRDVESLRQLPPASFVTSLSLEPAEAMLAVGTYDSGLSEVALTPPNREIVSSLASMSAQTGRVHWPSSAGALTAHQMAQLISAPSSTQQDHLAHINTPTGPQVFALDDDWRTRGNWLGRYGRYWACLCAMAGNDYLWGAGKLPVSYYAHIGPHHVKNDSIRYWIQWLYTTRVSSLELPPVYLDSRVVKGLTTRNVDRRQSSNDDHGEAYPQDWEGPTLYYDLAMPAGRYILAIYFVNKDGHKWFTRLRDYRISIRPGPAEIERGTSADLDFKSRPELAHARVHQFWGGVYKRFFIVGPQHLTIRVSRGSYDVIVSALMLDTLQEEPEPYFTPATTDQFVAMPNSMPSGHGPATLSGAHSSISTPLNGAAGDVALQSAIHRLKALSIQKPAEWAANASIAYAQLLREGLIARHAEKSALNANLQKSLGTCYFNLQIYNRWERCQQALGLTTARQIEKSLRWNQAIPAYSGRGRQTVIEYLASHSAVPPAADRRIPGSKAGVPLIAVH